jgi:hypothetical protein
MPTNHVSHRVMRHATVGAAGAIAALAVLLTAGCSSAATGTGSGSAAGSSSVVTPSGSGPASSDSAGAPTDTGAGSSAPTTASSTPAPPPVAPAGCTAAELTVSSIPPPAGGAAGHEGLVLLFTNHSTSACTLTGYPGAAGLNAAGSQILQATRTLSGMIGGCSCTHPPVLTLNPSSTVSAVIEGNIGGPGPCNAIHSLLVTPPNTTMSTPIAESVPSCGFQIHPVVTGQSGGGPA